MLKLGKNYILKRVATLEIYKLVQQIVEKPFGIYVCSSQKFCLGAMPFTYFAAHFAA